MPFALKSAAHQVARKPLRFVPRFDLFEDRITPANAVDPILEWNAVMLNANAVDHALAAPEQGGPDLTARAFAIVSVAMYDAFNSTENIGEKYLTKVPFGTLGDSSAAVAQAAHDTLVALFPSQSATFDAALDKTLHRVHNGASENLGRSVGHTVAVNILQARAHDMADSIGSPEYRPNGKPGFHDVDPLHPDQGFYAPGYFEVTPFALESMDQFQARHLDDSTPEGRIEFMQSAEYKAAYDEVKSLGGDGIHTKTSRTAEQTTIGVFWGYDGRPGLGTPPRLYNQIARTVALQEGNSAAENARLFALINVAMADAGLSAWTSKYEDDLWRPILGIRRGDKDENAATLADPDWTPLGAPCSNPRAGESNFTPPFPAYVSGHATFGAAMFRTLARFYGTDAMTFTVSSDEFNGVTIDADTGKARPVVTRTFHSFSEAAFENGQSRIYLGIHWAMDRDDGIKAGNNIADYVVDHLLAPNGRKTLFVYGTSGNDSIAITANSISINGVSTPFTSVAAIVVFGGQGDDTFDVARNVNIPVLLFGGPGKETVQTSNSHVRFVKNGFTGKENGGIETRFLGPLVAGLDDLYDAVDAIFTLASKNR